MNLKYVWYIYSTITALHPAYRLTPFAIAVAVTTPNPVKAPGAMLYILNGKAQFAEGLEIRVGGVGVNCVELFGLFFETNSTRHFPQQ